MYTKELRALEGGADGGDGGDGDGGDGALRGFVQGVLLERSRGAFRAFRSRLSRRLGVTPHHPITKPSPPPNDNTLATTQ